MRIEVPLLPGKELSPNARGGFQPNILTWPRRIAKSRIAVHLTIDGEPVSKQRPRLGFTRKGRAYTPRQTREAEDAIGWQIKSAYRGLLVDPDHAFGIRLLFHQSNYQRRDIDNMTKLVFDACNGIVWADDSQVIELIAHVFRGDEHPCTELCIYSLGIFTIPTTTCLACGKKFRTYASWGKKVYCSRACQIAATRTGILKQCAQCGTTIYRAPHKLKAGQYFCSLECKHLYGTVEVTCEQCGKVFRRPRSRRKGGRQFCSKICQSNFYRNQHAKHAQGVCIDCGRPTSKKQYQRCRACNAVKDTRAPLTIIELEEAEGGIIPSSPDSRGR